MNSGAASLSLAITPGLCWRMLGVVGGEAEGKAEMMLRYSDMNHSS